MSLYILLRHLVDDPVYPAGVHKVRPLRDYSLKDILREKVVFTRDYRIRL